MKVTKFQDSSQQEIQVQYSGGGDIRVYISNKNQEPPREMCMLLTEAQANILIASIIDLLTPKE